MLRCTSNRLPIFALGAMLFGVALGCREEPTGLTSPGPSHASGAIASVTLDLETLSLQPGGTGIINCTPRDAAGTALRRNCNWRTRDPSVATVTGSGTRIGTVTAKGVGATWVVANAEQSKDSVRLTVGTTPPPPAGGDTVLVLTPATATVVASQQQQFAAVGKTSWGTTVTLPLTWSATGGTVDGSGKYTAGSTAGTYRVIARSGTRADTSAVTVTAVAPPPPPSGGSVVLAAGDISSCSSSGDAATATLLDGLAGTIVSLGDHVYEDGTSSQFTNCYAPTWGRHKARTRPAPGNHDYNTSGAAAYYSYFGSNAGPAGRGYYSFDLGDWHIVSLNSNVSMSAGSAQEQWLRADLAASTKRCTLAYWHHSRFSSGTKHGNFSAAQPIWQALYDHNADVVLSGHEHNYERFGPQRADGTADATRGLRAFVVGTGGIGHYADRGTPKPNSQLFNGTTFGVLKLTLGATSYGWQFVPVAGQSFTDSGTGACH